MSAPSLVFGLILLVGAVVCPWMWFSGTRNWRPSFSRGYVLGSAIAYPALFVLYLVALCWGMFR